MFGLGRKKEERASFTQSTPQSFAELVEQTKNVELPSVTIQAAMGVPAIWAAVNFISGTIAGLPLNIFDKTEDGREKVAGPLASILHDAVSEEMTSFAWRKYTFERTLTGGRSFSVIQKDRAGRIAGLFPLNPSAVEVKRVDGKKRYIYTENGKKISYAASEIIDLVFTTKEDGIGHYGPIMTNYRAVAQAIAAEEYAAKFFAGGGVPPFAVSGNFQSANALNRSADDFAEAIRKASAEGRSALTMPDGLTITKLGTEPDKSQLLETQRFVVEQAGRIFSLPPTFLQDLTHGTYSNTEQQDLHFVKHTLKRWIEDFEQELNLKLFGRGNNKRYAEFNVDGLLRGDVKTRFEAYAIGVQNGIYMPNEPRLLENLAKVDGGDVAYIQGGSFPLTTQQNASINNETTPDNDNGDDDGA